MNKLPKGFPTHTRDMTGRLMCLGDMVKYDFPGEESEPFEIVFENNAFRKKYKRWEEGLLRPMLETTAQAKEMNMRII